MRDRLVDILATSTGQTRERITADIDRDYVVRGQAAVDYGLVDEIISARQLRPVTAIVPDIVRAGGEPEVAPGSEEFIRAST